MKTCFKWTSSPGRQMLFGTSRAVPSSVSKSVQVTGEVALKSSATLIRCCREGVRVDEVFAIDELRRRMGHDQRVAMATFILAGGGRGSGCCRLRVCEQLGLQA
jgi:hypothetical protein